MYSYLYDLSFCVKSTIFHYYYYYYKLMSDYLNSFYNFQQTFIDAVYLDSCLQDVFNNINLLQQFLGWSLEFMQFLNHFTSGV